MNQPSRLHDFLHAFTGLVDAGAQEERIFTEGRALLADLVAHDDWLPPQFARTSAERYQQYLLYCDPAARFCVVSFAWAPGQATPVHDHTVWGMVGVLRGAELCEEYSGTPPRPACTHRLAAGAVDLVSPTVGDIHRVSNACADGDSVSIHVYGADIGKVERHLYDPVSGAASSFISGYANEAAPHWLRIIDA